MNLNSFLSGVVLLGAWTAFLFFLRFWKKSRERLFLMFATSFFLLGFERIVLEVVDRRSEGRPFVFLIRLLAFVVIIYGVLEKNRRSRSSGSSDDQRSSIAPMPGRVGRVIRAP